MIVSETKESVLFFYTLKGKTFVTPSILLASARAENKDRILFENYYHER